MHFAFINVLEHILVCAPYTYSDDHMRIFVWPWPYRIRMIARYQYILACYERTRLYDYM